MAKAKASTEKPHSMKPALTPEARENQLIALAMDRAEEQLRNGTASSQVIAHFLKLGSTKERLEKQILAEQKKLVEAKTENLQSTKHSAELLDKALKAFSTYSGEEDEYDEEY